MKNKKDLQKSREAFKTRKLIFGLSAFSQTVNYILISASRGTVGKDPIWIILIALLAFSVCLDRRKAHVDWGYTVIMSVLYFAFIFAVILRSRLYWWLWVTIPEFLLYAVWYTVAYKHHSSKNHGGK